MTVLAPSCCSGSRHEPRFFFLWHDGSFPKYHLPTFHSEKPPDIIRLSTLERARMILSGAVPFRGSPAPPGGKTPPRCHVLPYELPRSWAFANLKRPCSPAGRSESAHSGQGSSNCCHHAVLASFFAFFPRAQLCGDVNSGRL